MFQTRQDLRTIIVLISFVLAKQGNRKKELGIRTVVTVVVVVVLMHLHARTRCLVIIVGDQVAASLLKWLLRFTRSSCPFFNVILWNVSIFLHVSRSYILFAWKPAFEILATTRARTLARISPSRLQICYICRAETKTCQILHSIQFIFLWLFVLLFLLTQIIKVFGLLI